MKAEEVKKKRRRKKILQGPTATILIGTLERPMKMTTMKMLRLGTPTTWSRPLKRIIEVKREEPKMLRKSGLTHCRNRIRRRGQN
jgi:hypothetical protein